MSISGNTPWYLIAHKREDGLIDYALMNPRGWGGDEMKHASTAGARDEAQMLARVENLTPPWQEEIEWHWVSADRLARITNPERTT